MVAVDVITVLLLWPELAKNGTPISWIFTLSNRMAWDLIDQNCENNYHGNPPTCPKIPCEVLFMGTALTTLDCTIGKRAIVPIAVRNIILQDCINGFSRDLQVSDLDDSPDVL
jgi:hypothetical protein